MPVEKFADYRVAFGLACGSIIIAATTFVEMLVVFLVPSRSSLSVEGAANGVGAVAGGVSRISFWIVIASIGAGVSLGTASLFWQGSSKLPGLVGIGFNILSPFLAVIFTGIFLSLRWR